MASVDEILKRWLKVNRSRQRARRDDMASAWLAVVGDEIARHTSVIEFARAELVVAVDSAALLTELSTYYRADLLESLRKVPEFHGLQKLRFRPGEL